MQSSQVHRQNLISDFNFDKVGNMNSEFVNPGLAEYIINIIQALLNQYFRCLSTWPGQNQVWSALRIGFWLAAGLVLAETKFLYV